MLVMKAILLLSTRSTLVEAGGSGSFPLKNEAVDPAAFSTSRLRAWVVGEGAVGTIEALLGPLWVLLKASWGHLGTSGGHVGGLLGFLGQSWRLMGCDLCGATCMV